MNEMRITGLNNEVIVLSKNPMEVGKGRIS